MTPNPDSMETESPAAFSIRDYIDVVWRRRWGFILAFIGVSCAGVLYTVKQPKIYEAVATVIINPEPPTVNPLEPSAAEQWYLRDTYYDTQLRVMQSKLVAQRVVDDLGLATNLDFLGLGLIKDPEILEKKLETADPVATLLSRLKIESVPGTRLANIRIRHKDPELAALIANSLAAAYSAQNSEHRSAALTNTFEFIEKQYRDNRDRLEKSRDALNEFKAKHKILYSNPVEQQKITNQKLTYINAKRVEIETERQKAGFTLNELKALPATPENARTFALLGESQSLETAAAECQKLEQKARELLITYLEKSPQVTAVREQIDNCNATVTTGMKNIIAGQNARFQALVKLEQELGKEVAKLQKEALELDQLRLLYEQFESQRQNSEKLYEQSQSKLNEVSLNRLLDINNIRLLDKAKPPQKPVSPNLAINAAITLLAAIIAGILAVILLELLDISVRTQHDVEQRARLPFIGFIPRFPKSRRYSGHKAYRFMIENPRSPAAECIRTMATTIDFLFKNDTAHILLITSAQPLEGKTMTSINLAVTNAIAGKRVVLIEADMRRPRIYKALKIDSKQGLSAAIEGHANPLDVLQSTEIDTLKLLPCGTIPQNPADIFSSPKFPELLQTLKNSFDLIIIDSPPVTLVTDALIIAQHVHGVIIVSRSGKTPIPGLIRTRELLENVHAPILGVVLNDMVPSGQSYYGGYYYHKGYSED